MSHKVPEGKIARSSIAGIAAMKVGAGYLKHKVKRPFLSQKKQQKDKETLHDNNAQILFKAISQLRGTALKLAQMLGMEQDLLPESYRRELEKSFHQVAPLNRVLIRKLMISEFKTTPEKLFAQFETQAFAAASLGQVHKAQHRNGSNLAVKIQYPGINVAIESDLTLIRKIVRGMANSKLILQSLDEIEARLKEEVDYRIEAENTQWFQQHVSFKGITIPQVFNKLSSHRVLTTGFMQGMHLDDWLASKPSQAIRNRTAQLLYNFYIYSSRDLQRLHADPNPGNYLFHQDGSISIIDFGCVRKMSTQFTKQFPRILGAYLNDDPQALFVAYEKLGMSYKNFDDSFYQQVLRPFGQWVTLPFQTERFNFKQHATYTQQGKQPMKNLHDFFGIDYVAEEFIFHNRTIYGLLQIFERMGATVRLRHHWVDL